MPDSSSSSEILLAMLAASRPNMPDGYTDADNLTALGLRPLAGKLEDELFSPPIIVGGKRSPRPQQPFTYSFKRGPLLVTDVHVHCHDQYGNVTKAILDVDINGVPLLPRWQDVKKAGSWLFFHARNQPNQHILGSRVTLTSHHIGHIPGGDETILMQLMIYGIDP